MTDGLSCRVRSFPAAGTSLIIITAIIRKRIFIRISGRITLIQCIIQHLTQFAKITTRIKEHFALIDARCLEFLCRIGRSTGLDTHTEITQVTHLDDISFIQYIDDFEQKLTDTTFQFPFGVRRTFSDILVL